MAGPGVRNGLRGARAPDRAARRRRLGGEDDEDDDEDDEPFDPHNEDDQGALRGAIDDLPLEFHARSKTSQFVVSDNGRRQRAYGRYQATWSPRTTSTIKS